MKKIRFKKFIKCGDFIFVLFIFFLFAFLSCTHAIMSSEDILRINDTIKPVISVFKPVNSSYYAAIVVVEGKVEDMADSKGTSGVVQTPLDFYIIGTNVKGSVSPGSDGTFSFSFSTTGFSGDKTLVITALDWNGNTGTAEITLKEGAFPNFTATPGNESLYLRWEPVEMAINYILYYTIDGSIPSVTNSEEPEQIGTGELLEGFYFRSFYELKNGNLYSFLLKAEIAGSDPSWSKIVQAVPVSRFTFAPKVTGGYKKISLQWANPNPGKYAFIVSKATVKDGAYTDFSININGNSIEDTKVEDGVLYYYQVRPALNNSIINSWGISGETVPVPPFAQVLGVYDTPNRAYNIELRDNLAFIADKESGLQVIDISNPAVPVFVGSCDTPNNAFAVVLDGDYAYVADDGSGLQVVNIANPALPVLAGSCTLTGNAFALALKENHAYIAARAAGLEVVDISAPTTPRYVTAYDADGAGTGVAYGIALDGNYAYIANGLSGLRIVNIKNPAAPAAAGYFDTDGIAYAVAVKDNYAYVADGASGLQVIDIGIPGSPSLAGSCDTAGNATGIAIDGNYAYLADETGGMVMIDISQPGKPRPAGSYTDSVNIKGIKVRGRFGYLASQEAGIQIINIGGPHRMESVSTYTGLTTVNRMALSGSYAYLTDNDRRLQVLDISRPASPLPRGTLTWDTELYPFDVVVCGDYAFVTGNFTGLQVVSIQDPDNPSIAGSIQEPDFLNSHTIDSYLLGDYIYVLYSTVDTGNSGIKIYNIALPEKPRGTGTPYEVYQYAKSINIKNNYLYAANYTSGLYITDAADNVNPRIYSLLDTPGQVSDIDFFGDFALVADGYAGIRLVNILDPLHAVIVSSLDTPGFAGDTALGTYYALVADGANGDLLTVNISKPAVPLLMGIFSTGDGARYVTTRGRYGYITLANTGLKIVDLWPDL